jgi:hypothetical protein
MSSRTEKQRAVCVARVEHEVGRAFPQFRERVGILEAREIARTVGCAAPVVAGKTHDGTWGHVEPGPDGRIVLARRVPRFVVLHEVAHARLAGVRATDHGLRFLECYVDTVWDYTHDKALCRTLEAALRTAR